MRPPTRSTRSARPPSNKVTTSARRSSQGASGATSALAVSTEAIHTTPPPKPKLRSQSMISIAASAAAATPTDDDDANVYPSASPGSDDAPVPAAPIVSYFHVLLPSSIPTFVLENPHPESESGPHDAGPIVLGKPPPLQRSRSRHRMSSEKLETLDALFRRNTHPSRKEKEAICKDLNMDLKTVTIWFQNKRQTVTRSRKLLESEGATSMPSTAAMDMLASASATMSPLAAPPVKPSVSRASSTVHIGSGSGSPCPDCCSSPDQSAVPRLRHTSSCDSVPARSLTLGSPRVPLSAAVAYDPNVFFDWVWAETSSSCVSSPSPAGLRKPRLGHNGPIHPEDLWKHIPSSPALPAFSSPDVSPDIGSPSKGGGLSVEQPRTLEWACARSAKRRRTNPDAIHHEDEGTDSECNSVDPSDACRPSFSVSEARVPLECYDKYPLDVVRGAVLLLKLRDAGRGLGI